MRRLETLLVGLALALFVIGVALFPLTQPAFTRIVAGRFALTEQAGLTRSQMLTVAEQVRVFVIDGDRGGDTLPATVDGRAGFDQPAVSHLLDVRRVISGAQLLTGLLAAAITIWIGVEVARQRTGRIASAMNAAAIICVALVVIAGLSGFVDFERLFTAFHGLFFSAGTWEFPADSLLIQTFPETFWATAGAVWAMLILLGAGALAIGARLVRDTPARFSAGDEGKGVASGT